MKRTKIIPINWINEGHDTDMDGVPNYRDCNILNPFEHRGVRPSKTMQKRLEKLPIYVTDEPFRTETAKRFEMPSEYWKGIYPLMSKKAQKRAPRSRRELLSTIKKYPSVVSEIERTKPKILLYSSQTFPEEEEAGFEIEEKVVVKPSQLIYSTKQDVLRQIKRKIPKHEQKEAIREYIEFTPYPMEETIEQIGRKQRRHVARAIFHELAHVRQERTMGKAMRLQRKHPYSKRPIEIEAERRAKEKLKEREQSSVLRNYI